MLWACVFVRFAWSVVLLSSMCCALSCNSTGANCLPLLLFSHFFVSLNHWHCLAAHAGCVWDGPAVCVCMAVWTSGLSLCWLFGRDSACPCVWIVVVVPSRCPPAWLTRPRCPLLGARQQSPGRGTAFCHLFLFSLSFSVLCLSSDRTHFSQSVSLSLPSFVHFPLTPPLLILFLSF